MRKALFLAFIATLLMLSLSGCRTDTAKELDKMRLSIDEESLFRSISEKNIQAVKLLLDVGIDPNCEHNGHLPLCQAVRSGNFDIVESLLESGADANATDSKGNTALSYAALGGNTDIVRLLLSRETDVQTTNPNGHTPLTLATRAGKVATVALLLEHGANVNHATVVGMTSLMFAAEDGHKEIVETLLGQGADIDSINNRGESALLTATKKGETEIVDILLKHYANPDVIDFEGTSSLAYAAVDGAVEIADLLLVSDANPNIVLADGHTALTLAAANGQTEVVRTLLKSGARIPWEVDWDTANRQLRGIVAPIADAYVNAAKDGDLELIKLFVKAGLNPEATTPFEESALLRAASYGHLDIVDYLLKIGADPDKGDFYGVTPLMSASVRGNKEIVETLLEHGANIHASGICGQAIKSASLGGNVDIIGILLSHGAEINGSSGNSPIQAAAFNGHVDAVEFLLDNGANIDAIGGEDEEAGVTALYSACEQGHTDVVRLLIKRGANVNAVMDNSFTPLMAAARGGYEPIVKMLLDNGADREIKDWREKTALDSALENGQYVFAGEMLQLYEPAVGGPQENKEINSLKTGAYTTETVASGGEITDSRSINSFRWQKHDGFERIIVNISGQNPNYYKLEYLQYPYRMFFRMCGVRRFYARYNIPEFDDSNLIAGIYPVVVLDDCEDDFVIVFRKPVKYELIELSNNARLVLDITYDKEAEKLPDMFCLRSASYKYAERQDTMRCGLQAATEREVHIIPDATGTYFVEEGRYITYEEAEARRKELGDLVDFGLCVEKRGACDLPKKGEIPLSYDSLTVRYYTADGERVTNYLIATYDDNSKGLLTDDKAPILIGFEDYDVSLNFIAARKEGLWGFYDIETHEMIIDHIYEDIYESIRPDDYKVAHGLIQVKVDGVWGAIDQNGKMIIEPAWNTIYLNYYEEIEPFVKVKKDGKYGYLTYDGQIILDAEWDEAFMDVLNVPEDVIFVKKDDEWGGIKIENNIAGEVDWSIKPAEF